MMTTKNTEFSALCEAWSRFLMERYEIEINADAVGMILTRLGNGTQQGVDVVMRYIGSRERDESLKHAGLMKGLAADHGERMDDIKMKAKHDRLALQDRRGRAGAKLRVALMQCTTELEHSAAYAAMDKEIEEISQLMWCVDDAERRQKSEEIGRHLAAQEAEELRYGRMLYHWRMWKDATCMMFSLGLVLPEEEEGGKS